MKSEPILQYSVRVGKKLGPPIIDTTQDPVDLVKGVLVHCDRQVFINKLMGETKLSREVCNGLLIDAAWQYDKVVELSGSKKLNTNQA